jgi:2'-5' RNA ligase
VSPSSAKGNWFVALPVVADRWYDALSAHASKARGVASGASADAPSLALSRLHRDDLHLTIAFLGACGEEQALRAWATLEGWSAPALAATLGHLVPLGNPRRPSAIALTLTEGNEAVASLLGSLRDAMFDAAEVPRDLRVPLPHITVFRVPRHATSAERRSALEWVEACPPVPGRIRFETVALYAWAEGRSERRFRTVIERPLT